MRTNVIGLYIVSILCVLIIIGIFFGGSMKITSRIVQVTQKIPCMGLMVSTSEKTMMKDIPEVYSKIMKLKDENKITGIKLPWEYISLSTNYSGSSAWDYYTGYVINDESSRNDNLIKYSVPVGEYAVFTLRCKTKIFFGIKLGMLKQKIYTKWLPSSEYKFDNFEYEYNNEEMWKQSPYDIDLYVKIVKK